MKLDDARRSLYEAGRSRQQMIDRHDSARYALDMAGGLHRYVVVEAYRWFARTVRKIRHLQAKRQ